MAMHIRSFLPILTLLGIGALGGWGYGLLFGNPISVSMIHGVFIGTPILAYERGRLLRGLRTWIRRASTPFYAVSSLLIFLAMIVAGNTAAGILIWATGFSTTTLDEGVLLNSRGLTYSTLVSAITLAVFRVRDLVGAGTLLNLLVGRYHKPVREERVFLFLDLVGSTRFAEQHGDLRTQEFLGRVFEVLAGPVGRYRGSIDDYIGDMAIVTWKLRPGTRNGAAISCVFAFLDEIERGTSEWLRQFGEVPRFRAALHCGPVVTAEIGLDRHKITYFGDVVNTTSRLESLSKSLDRQLLVSADLLERVQPLPAGIVADDLGLHALRGRDEQLSVASLQRQPPCRERGAI